MTEQRETKNWTFPGVPVAPDSGKPDWPFLQKRFSWLRAMDGVPQSPVYHAEGDVLIHTRMVIEALLNLPEWQGLSADDRQLLFAATLLHDIGKPACTVVEDDGHISSRGHAKKGEKMARRLLWLGEELPAPVPFFAREQIANLVRWHGLPLQFLDKPDLARSVIEASQSTRLDLVALLSEADVRGRVCDDQQELLDRVELFREFCQEQDCYTAPRPFTSEYSRFVYLHSERGDPNYAAYDATRFEVVLMSGLPGSGKDTWIRTNLPDWPVISLDELRKELGISPHDDQGYLIQVARERARTLLRQQRSFIWNATSITHIQRRRVIDLALDYSARTRIVYVHAPFTDILQRNQAREETVPENVIYRMLNNLEMPQISEAHRIEWALNSN
ncbi:MAG TPA: AAA family ATPase [Ktedonobacteraceae bacterium]|nr:AAA family ATPase [Ktedonobacteraceae bacterium]